MGATADLVCDFVMKLKLLLLYLHLKDFCKLLMFSSVCSASKLKN